MEPVSRWASFLFKHLHVITFKLLIGSLAILIGGSSLASMGSNIGRLLNDCFGICIKIFTRWFLCNLCCRISTRPNYDAKTGYYTKTSYHTGYYTETGDNPETSYHTGNYTFTNDFGINKTSHFKAR